MTGKVILAPFGSHAGPAQAIPGASADAWCWFAWHNGQRLVQWKGGWWYVDRKRPWVSNAPCPLVGPFSMPSDAFAAAVKGAAP
jgi:hypothetical protein